MPRLTLALVLAAALLLSRLSQASATCDPSTCCTCNNGYTDADNDTWTIGGAVSLCFDPSVPTGYRTTPSANPDCDDTNPAIGYIPAQSCPTTCGYAGGTVPDGSCGLKTCPATGACYSQGYYQSYYYNQGYYYGQSYYYTQPSYYSQGYYQGYYYGQIWYYGEPGYYNQSYYYGQIWYYGEPGYYGQGGYCCICCPGCFC